MIECTDQKIYKKVNRRKKKSRFFSFVKIILVVAICYCYLHFCIGRVLADICYDYVDAYCAKSVNTAIMNSLSDSLDYSDLIRIEKNSSGEITFMSVNSVKVNSISQKIVKASKTNIEAMLYSGIPIPTMAYTGIKFLSGYGKTVAFKALSIAEVNCSFDGKFESMGINQTKHSIYAQINCKVNIGVPLDDRTVECKTQVLIIESVIVGKVPEIYLNGQLF